MEIKILGPGCAKCKKTEKIVRQVVSDNNADATVEKVTDMMEIAGYGVVSTPAIVVDGDVKSTGKIPGKEDILAWLNG
jgi:small redox-active disulfide protein 2